MLLLLDHDVGDVELLHNLQILLTPCHASQRPAASTVHHGVQVQAVRVENKMGDMWGTIARLALVLWACNILMPVSLLAACRAEGTGFSLGKGFLPSLGWVRPPCLEHITVLDFRILVGHKGLTDSGLTDSSSP